MSDEKRPPHPATVAVERAPHAATVQRREAPFGMPKVPPPHPATVQRVVVQAKTVQERAPHAATVLVERPTYPATAQRREVPRGTPIARSPHVATAIQRSSSSSSVSLASQPTQHEQQEEIEQVARLAVRYVKAMIVWGAGNVKDSIIQSKGRSKLAFEQSKQLATNRQYRTVHRQAKSAIEKIFARAAIPVKSGGGNCQEHADLAFMWLYENTTGITLNMACGEDHGYVIIGNPNDESTWFVVDPWPHVARIGAYSKVACQPMIKWEVEGASDRRDLHGAQAVFQEALKALPNPETDAEDLKPMDETELAEILENAYDVG